jgi:hypothetical protein
MNWKEYISKFNTTESIYSFKNPAPHFILEELQAQFGLKELPHELVELYRQTNGVDETLNGDTIGELVWTVERVIETNKQYRTSADFKELYMSFDQLFFVSDASNGDLFGFVTLQGRFDRHDIFVWDHEDDSRKWVAPNLTKFIEWRETGKIQV